MSEVLLLMERERADATQIQKGTAIDRSEALQGNWLPGRPPILSTDSKRRPARTSEGNVDPSSRDSPEFEGQKSSEDRILCQLPASIGLRIA